MINRDLITSGFDIEMNLSENYLIYLLLAQVEAGIVPLVFNIADPQQGFDFTISLHPPIDYLRLYETNFEFPEPLNGSFLIRLLPVEEEAFLALTIIPTIVDNGTGSIVADGIPATALIDIELTANDMQNDMETNHRLAINFLRFDNTTRAILESANLNVAIIESLIRERINTELDLGAAQSAGVQALRMKKFINETHRSIGLYINLSLRNGPEPGSFNGPRGDLENAQDFREEGSKIAFATSPELFGLLGPDFMFRLAEETEPNSGQFHFPLRENPLDRKSVQIGIIKDVAVRRQLIMGVPTGRLEINIHGEYTDALGDPDFNLQIFFNPKIENGLVNWELDVDIDFGLLGTLLFLAGSLALSIIFVSPFIAYGSVLFITTLATAALAQGLIAEPLVARYIQGRIVENQEVFASFFDAIPLRFLGNKRRWDPFYSTNHQVVSLTDRVIIDENGLAFEATTLKLGKEPEPINHVVIRDEERNSSGMIAALRYRVRDFGDHIEDFEADAPGVDRLSFSRSNPEIEPNLVSLSDGQIIDRIATSKILSGLSYTAKRIYLQNNQIEQLLCLSFRERGEERDRVINDFRRRVRDEMREEVIAELTDELGRPPIEEEINNRLNEIIAVREPEFIENELPSLLEAAIVRVLRFDLAPEEMIERQLNKILILEGKEIIVRRNADGSTIKYYRDRPDGNPRDNLLTLPTYIFPFQPPT